MRYILANKKQESMQILPFWLMSIFKALEAFYFLTNMTWEVFGMSGKFKFFQWWSQVVEFDTKHLNVVGISFAQVCLSLPHSNLPNKGSWARARGYSCAQALPLVVPRAAAVPAAALGGCCFIPRSRAFGLRVRAGTNQPGLFPKIFTGFSVLL